MTRCRSTERRQRADVGDRHVEAAGEQRPRLAGEDERLRGAQAGAPLHPLADEVLRVRPRRPRGVDEPHRVAGDLVRDGDVAHDLLERLDVGAGEDAQRLGRRRCRSCR